MREERGFDLTFLYLVEVDLMHVGLICLLDLNCVDPIRVVLC